MCSKCLYDGILLYTKSCTFTERTNPVFYFLFFPKSLLPGCKSLVGNWCLISSAKCGLGPWRRYMQPILGTLIKKIKGKHICLVGFYVDFPFGRRECLISLWILNNNFELSQEFNFNCFFFFSFIFMCHLWGFQAQ